MKISRYIFGIVLLIFYQNLPAQLSHVRVGGSVGFFTYQGDLDANRLGILSPGMGIGLMASHRPAKNFEFKLQLNYGRISGDDNKGYYYPERNLHFRSNIFEAAGSIIWEISARDRDHRHETYSYWYGNRSNFSPYIGIGVGVMYFNPQGKHDGQWIDLHPLGTEGQYLKGDTFPDRYSLVQPTIPLTIGFRFKTSEVTDVFFEVSTRKTFTDYLDDVSGYYPDAEKLFEEKGQTAVDMAFGYLPEGTPPPPFHRTRRGDEYESDWYTYVSVTFSYLIPWYRIKR